MSFVSSYNLYLIVLHLQNQDSVKSDFITADHVKVGSKGLGKGLLKGIKKKPEDKSTKPVQEVDAGNDANMINNLDDSSSKEVENLMGNTPLIEARLCRNNILIKLLEEVKYLQLPEFPSSSLRMI
ncbi:hypothetical protein Tco_0124657, partial [Tanacetum coccineum]